MPQAMCDVISGIGIGIGIGSAAADSIGFRAPARYRSNPNSGAFSPYLDAFWQAFSSNLSLVKLFPREFFFQIFALKKVSFGAFRLVVFSLYSGRGPV